MFNYADLKKNTKPYVIAEIGANHNGDIELAKKIIDEAVRCVVGGVDGVNVPPPARKLGGVIPADTVELHGMDAAQRTDRKSVV